jgi:hypothetical protein
MKLLVAALRHHVRQTRKSLRALESELAWGHGTLGNVLRGRSEVRLHHVESLARVLGLKPIDLLREAYDDATGGVVAITLPEEHLSTLIREAVTSALEGTPKDPSRANPAETPDLSVWLSAHEPEGWKGVKTAFRSGAKARLAGKDSTSTSYREGDRFFEHFHNGFKAMDEAIQSGAVFSCPSCGQPLPYSAPEKGPSHEEQQHI